MSNATTHAHSHLSEEAVLARAQVMYEGELDFKGELVRIRRAAGLTQRDVADIIGISQQAIHKLERYDSDPKLSTLSRYANAIGALIEYKASRDVGQSVWKVAQVRSPHGHDSSASGIKVTSEKRVTRRPGSWMKTGGYSVALAA